jgi:hypothetical protein
MASLADQLGWCITTKDYLNNLNAELKYVSNSYLNFADELKNSGYLEEMLLNLNLDILTQEFEEEIDKLIQYIENDHLDYIDKQSQTIQGHMGFN